jgi:hypothetical protein
MTAYLSKTNVQLGASYHTGTQSNTKYEEGYQAAAKYINAGRDEIGIPCRAKLPNLILTMTSHRSINYPTLHEPRQCPQVQRRRRNHPYQDGARDERQALALHGRAPQAYSQVVGLVKRRWAQAHSRELEATPITKSEVRRMHTRLQYPRYNPRRTRHRRRSPRSRRTPLR